MIITEPIGPPPIRHKLSKDYEARHKKEALKQI